MPRFPFFPSPKKKADTAAIAEQKAADEKAAQEDAATKVAAAYKGKAERERLAKEQGEIAPPDNKSDEAFHLKCFKCFQ